MNAPTGPLVAPRSSSVSRTTSETAIELRLTLDGAGKADVYTGIGFSIIC